MAKVEKTVVVTLTLDDGEAQTLVELLGEATEITHPGSAAMYDALREAGYGVRVR